MVLNKDFREFVALLNENQVKYLVIGGYAVAYHGYPRYTKDIDIWIERKEINAKNLISVIQKFGMSSMNLIIDDFLDKDAVIQLGMPPNRIDILTDLEVLDFDYCYSKKELASFDNLIVNFIDLESLIVAKKQANRIQDKADVRKLKEQQRKKKIKPK